MEHLLIPLQSSINIIPDGVLIIDSRSRILVVNSQAEIMFGYQKHELTGKHLHILIPERYHKIHRIHVREYWKNPAVRIMSQSQSLFGLRQGGGEFDISIALSPAVLKNRKVIVATVRDITETRELQRALQWKNEQLKSINTELERFGYTISHDLKSPLANLHAIIDLLVRELPEERKGDFEGHIYHINKTLYSMSELVSGVAAYSMATLPGETSGTEVDINKIIQEVMSMVLIPTHITLKVARNLPITWGNKTKILQVFLNLISNSIKYNNKKKGVIRVSGRQNRNTIVICIDDNGPGISPRLRKQVFSLFEKGKSMRLDSQGIGLAIVHKVIKELGGTIAIGKSELGGAEFRFELPVMKKQEVEQAPNACPVIH